MTVAAPVLVKTCQHGASTVLWRDPETLRHRDKVTLVPLPSAYTPLAFATSFARTRRTLLEHITRNRYLSFGIGGLIGDWAALGARLAQSRGLRYSIHTDRVEHELLFKLASQKSPATEAESTAGWAVDACLSSWNHSRLRFRTLAWQRLLPCLFALGSGEPPHPRHSSEAGGCDSRGRARSQAAKCNPGTAAHRLCRAVGSDESPTGLAARLGAARDLGADFEAVWLGDGPLHDDFHACLDQLGLRDYVRAPGFISERAPLLAELRRAHIFVFTHVTPESPRCLLEALVSGSPIVGYQSAFAEELTAGRGGGAYVPLGDWQALGAKIAELAR